MRNSANRREIDRLYILGAGASLAASAVQRTDGSTSTYQAPLDKDFPARIAGLDLQRPEWVGRIRDQLVQKFRPDGGFEAFPLEEGILRQVELLQFFKAIHPRRSRDQVEPGEWLDWMAHLICVVLRRTRENNFGAYSRLVGCRFPPGVEVAALTDRIITFNYDTLLDSILLADRKPTDVYFDTIRRRRDREADGSQSHPLLLKLHGSVNWRCNEEHLRAIIQAESLDAEEYEIPSIWMDQSRAPTPGDEDSPLIIPPLPNKPVTAVRIFKYLWTGAYEYLYEARELVVVGSSLPPADAVAVSMFGSFRSSRLERIIIADPSTAALDRWRPVLTKERLGNVRWTYYQSFRDYLEQECGEENQIGA